MATKVLQSNQITFVDTTDARQLEVSIASSLPTVQIYNSNTKTYSPDWKNGLTLTASVYLDSRIVTSNTITKIEWFEQIGTGSETSLGSGLVLNINSNKMTGDTTMITYICKVRYEDSGENSPSAQTKLTFVRTDTGINGINGLDGKDGVDGTDGVDGKNAPKVIAQYSVDGNDPWANELENTHKYIRFSYDGGLQWDKPIKIAGQDGTSVKITGTAYCKETLSDDNVGDNVVLYTDETYETIIDSTSHQTGDAYIVQKYLCVYNESTGSFICSGIIQGPQGNDGKSSYMHIRYANNESGTDMDENPINKIYIGTCVTSELIGPTDPSVYKWRRFVGNDGKDGKDGKDGADAYTLVLTNESHTFVGDIANAIDGSTETQILVYKGGETQDITISKINGKSASTSVTGTGIAGLLFECSALTGKSPKITFTCTTILTQATGTIPIEIIVDGITFTKIFTYSIAFKGSNGDPGTPSTSYWLVSNANVIQKTSAGDVAFTPSTLTFTGKSKLGASAPIDYACRWIVDYTVDGTTYTNLYTSATNETNVSITPDGTYKAIRARMYLAGNITTLLDEQIIPFISDGIIGESGTSAVTFQVYSTNGYALSTNTPTITLQTFAYLGDVEIKAGASYQWYRYEESGWAEIDGAINSYFDVSRNDVSFVNSYMCKMQFNDSEYTGVVTVDDKSDDNKVFTTKPSAYAVGDLWIVGTDYIPTNITVGTLLKAQHTSNTYSDDDWVLATKYDDQIEELKNEVSVYNQHFSFTSDNGIKMSARDQNGVESKFSTSLTNTQLSFNYGDEAIAYINGTKMNIKEAEIESPLTVTGKYSGSTMLQAPIINLGAFSLVIESNGSLSIVANI